jgi:hypothetical protein
VSLVTEEFSGFLVDEMKPRAGETDDGQIGIGTGGIGTGLVRRGRRKLMLYVSAQPWTFEKDMSAHTPEYAELAERVTSVWLRSWTVRKGNESFLTLLVMAGARGGVSLSSTNAG